MSSSGGAIARPSQAHAAASTTTTTVSVAAAEPPVASLSARFRVRAQQLLFELEARCFPAPLGLAWVLTVLGSAFLVYASSCFPLCLSTWSPDALAHSLVTALGGSRDLGVQANAVASSVGSAGLVYTFAGGGAVAVACALLRRAGITPLEPPAPTTRAAFCCCFRRRSPPSTPISRVRIGVIILLVGLAYAVLLFAWTTRRGVLLRPACHLEPVQRRATLSFAIVTGPLFRDHSPADAQFAALSQITVGNKRAYASRHGYKVFAPIFEPRDDPRNSSFAWFAKIDLMKDALLAGHDWVFWNDLDTLIMEHAITLESIVFGGGGDKDDGGDSMPDLIISSIGCTGMFLLRRSAWSFEYLDRWRQVPPRSGHGDGLDMGASQYVLANESFAFSPSRDGIRPHAHVRYVPHCAFNSNAALWDWDQRFMHGDFAVHCAGDLRRSARIPQLEAIRRGERSALDLTLHLR